MNVNLKTKCEGEQSITYVNLGSKIVHYLTYLYERKEAYFVSFSKEIPINY